MARSQNGYTANDRSKVATYKTASGVPLAIRKGDVATVLLYVANRFHNEVEHLKRSECYGYAERKIRGSSTTLSNHASGTAIDLNASDHWLGDRGTFSKSQQAAIRRILKSCGGVVRWGGDYHSRKDEMHFEINAGTAKVAALAAKIKGTKTPAKATAKPATAVPSGYKRVHYGDTLRRGSYGSPVGDVQRMLGIKADQAYGPTTDKRVRAFQKAHHLTADGIVGPKTWTSLKKHGKH